MKIYEVVFKMNHEKMEATPMPAHYWSGDNVSFVAQAAAEYATDYEPLKDSDHLELVSVKYVLTVTKAVDEVSDAPSD